MRLESLQKHKQDSLNIKPKTHNHLALTKAQKCNYFVYQKSLVYCGCAPHTLKTINFTDLVGVKLNKDLINLKPLLKIEL